MGTKKVTPNHALHRTVESGEFVPDPILACGCGVAWIVDTRTKGPYHHPNGSIFTIEGIKKSWRFVGDSQKCLLKVNWLGPW